MPILEQWTPSPSAALLCTGIAFSSLFLPTSAAACSCIEEPETGVWVESPLPRDGAFVLHGETGWGEPILSWLVTLEDEAGSLVEFTTTIKRVRGSNVSVVRPNELLAANTSFSINYQGDVLGTFWTTDVTETPAPQVPEIDLQSISVIDECEGSECGCSEALATFRVDWDGAFALVSYGPEPPHAVGSTSSWGDDYLLGDTRSVGMGRVCGSDWRGAEPGGGGFVQFAAIGLNGDHSGWSEPFEVQFRRLIRPAAAPLRRTTAAVPC